MLSPRPTAHLRSQISAFVSARQAEALRDYLRTLRNSDFRAAGIVMSEAKCWEQLDEAEFWHFFLILNVDNTRAYLGTLLKATVARHKVQSLTFEGEDFGRFATETATDIDRRKALEALLPLLSAPEAVEQMLQRFLLSQETPVTRALCLLRISSPATLFLLFRTLKEVDDDPNLIRRFAVELIRRGDKQAYNMACILRDYFDLEALPGTFSLQLAPYELSRLDTNFDYFFKILAR